MNKQYIIFDLDGTLALDDHRRDAFDGDGDIDWDAYYLRCTGDAPNTPIIILAQALTQYYEERDDVSIEIWTGRGDIAVKETRAWLERHAVPYHYIRMRPAGDYRHDYELKKEWLTQIGTNNVMFCVDDRQQSVDMWRKCGLTCLQVAPNSF